MLIFPTSRVYYRRFAVANQEARNKSITQPQPPPFTSIISIFIAKMHCISYFPRITPKTKSEITAHKSINYVVESYFIIKSCNKKEIEVGRLDSAKTYKTK